MALNPTPTFQLQPSASESALATNYITNFELLESVSS
jgi:hypothetical protein